MKIRNSIVAVFASAPLLLIQFAGASPSCPTQSIGELPFDQSCKNACPPGTNVGPGVLTSGEANTYDVAGIYFGHQNWGSCVGMVSTMANAYEGLTEEERGRVFLLAVGKDDYKGDYGNFCQGFASCADDIDASWWTAWDVAQRDVFFYIKKDDESWEYYCRYSMNTGKDEFDDTIREMLTITSAIIEDVDGVDVEMEDDFIGNETSIDAVETSIDAVETSIDAVIGEEVEPYVSSASLSSKFAPFWVILGSLGWSAL